MPDRLRHELSASAAFAAAPARGPAAGRVRAWLLGAVAAARPRRAWSAVVLALAARRRVLDWASTTVLDRPFDPLIDWTLPRLGRSACSATRSGGPARRDRSLVRGAADRAGAGRSLPLRVLRAPWPARCATASGHAGRRRVLGRGLDAARGVRPAVARRRSPRPPPRLRRTTRSAGSATGSPTGDAFAARDRRRPLRRRARRPAADRAARQGRARSSSSRATAGSPSRTPSFSPEVDAVLDDGTRGCARRASRPAARSSPRRRSARRAGWPTRPLQSGLWVDSQQRYDQLLTSDRLTLTERVRARRLAHRLRRARPTPSDWPEGRRSTATTSSTTPATSATRGPRFGYANDAGPVHPRDVPPARARAGATGRR